MSSRKRTVTLMRVVLTLPEDFPVPPTAALPLGMISRVGGWVKVMSTSSRARPTGGIKILGVVVVGLQVCLDRCVVVVVAAVVVVVVTVVVSVGFVPREELEAAVEVFWLYSLRDSWG